MSFPKYSPLTSLQSKVYAAVLDYFQAHGFGPTLSEISSALMKLPREITPALNDLVERGWVIQEIYTKRVA